jgi:hypothetical protein
MDLNLQSLSIQELEDLYFETSGEYEEIPVDIETFVYHREFLGEYFNFDFNKYWLKVLKDIFPSPMISDNYFLLILRGSIGRGKTTTACVGILYDIYRMLCLRDPQATLGFNRKQKLMNAMFNISLSAAKDVGWNIINNMMLSSPYFKEQINIAPKAHNRTLLPKDIGFKVGSRLGHTLGQAVINVILDEANFGILKDQIYENFNSLLRRMESRFLLGKIWITTSEKNTSSLVNTILTQYKDNDGLYVDGSRLDNSALWHVYPDKYSDECFQIFIGDNEVPPKIIDDSDSTTFVEENINKIINVPLFSHNDDGSTRKVKDSFKADIYKALQDLAGISTSSAYNLFRHIDKLTKSFTGPNIFPDVIQLDFFDETDQISNYILPQFTDYLINGPYKGKPITIHVDTAYKGDICGIGATVLTGFEVIKIRDKITFKDTDVISPLTRTLFSVGIKNKESQQVPLKRVINFIKWLIAIGVPVIFISFDGFQSVYMIQELQQSGYNADKISVDIDSFHYNEFRDCIYRGSHTMAVNELLRKELEALEVVEDVNKIDHPRGGSKDISDGACGSHAGMLQHAYKYRGMFSALFQNSEIDKQSRPIQALLENYKIKNPSSGFTDEELEELHILDAQMGVLQ